MEPHMSLRALFGTGKKQKKQLESISDSTAATYHENLRSAITVFEECRSLTERMSLFSPNETEDDISSSDLQYLQINYYLAELFQRENVLGRKTALELAQAAYGRYLKLLDSYEMLSKANAKLHERYLENPDEFALVPSSDPAELRNTKILRFKQEKELKLKLEYLSQTPIALQQDDAAIREVNLAEIQLSIHSTFQALDIIVQEFKILALMPNTSPQPGPEDMELDYRQRNGFSADTYSDRLDAPLSQLFNRGKAGPILSKDGRPLKPFTLLDNRQQIRDGVFRQDHALPTMTIDEYLEEEKRRGGMIDGGGEQSGVRQQPDEDNVEKADQETMKAREWDEFVEANPKGSGNTLNRG
ncbi:MAG: hypothetical protein Q9190_006598 [Brigantiaea leucoxantha]